MNQGMTAWGWVALLLGWGTILGFSLYCMARVMRGKKKAHAEVVGPGVQRVRWATRIGLVLAMAGNASGLGNFLRFPVKAAQSGGGAFLMGEFKLTHKKAVHTIFGLVMLCILFVVFFFKYGVLDELDFWASTLGIVLFGVVEVIVFSWIYGVKKGWAELHKGADIKVPRFFKFVFKYITPAYILIILVVWTIQDAVGTFLMKKEAEKEAVKP